MEGGMLKTAQGCEGAANGSPIRMGCVLPRAVIVSDHSFSLLHVPLDGDEGSMLLVAFRGDDLVPWCGVKMSGKPRCVWEESARPWRLVYARLSRPFRGFA